MSADLIAARREARRRKILENSERRLIQIAGKAENNIGDTDSAENENKVNGSLMTCSTTKCTDRLPNGLVRPLLNNDEQEPYLRLKENLKQFVNENDDCTSDFMQSRTVKATSATSGERSNVQRIQHTSEYQKWLHHVLLIICAAMTRILFGLQLGNLIGMNVLVPFIMVVVLRLTLTYQSMSVAPSGMFRAVLVLSGISPQKLTVSMTIFNVVTTVLEDFALYMFTFIVVHSLFSSTPPSVSSSSASSSS